MLDGHDDAPAFDKERKLNVPPGKHTFLGQYVPLFATLGDAYDAGVAALGHLFSNFATSSRVIGAWFSVMPAIINGNRASRRRNQQRTGDVNHCRWKPIDARAVGRDRFPR